MQKSSEVHELQIVSIVPEVDYTRLATSLASCKNLKHLSIGDATQTLLSAICSLPHLVSLKLTNCVAQTLFEDLAKSEFTGSLECLSIQGKEHFSLAQLSSFARHAAKFVALRDIRLLPIDTGFKSQAMQSLIECLRASPLLHTHNENLETITIALDDDVGEDEALMIVTSALRSSCIVDFSLAGVQWPWEREESVLAALKQNKSHIQIGASRHCAEVGHTQGNRGRDVLTAPAAKNNCNARSG